MRLESTQHEGEDKKERMGVKEGSKPSNGNSPNIRPIISVAASRGDDGMRATGKGEGGVE